jgi:hypothetical protein
VTLPRLALMLSLAGLGAVSIGGAALEARWARETRAVVADAGALGREVRRIDDELAHARVRLALEHARSASYDAAPVHLVVSRADGRLSAERGSVVLRTMGLITVAPIGVDTVRSVGAQDIVFAGSGRVDAVAGLTAADLAALRRLVRVGTVLYVL